MKILNTSYHNIDFNSDFNFPKNHNEIVSLINQTINTLPALNIIKNKNLLNDTMMEISEFQSTKNTFLIFGTGGSNLGARALINTLQGKDSKKIYFYDNIDPVGFYNSINKINFENAGFIFISKSGYTPETLSQFATIIEFFDKKNNLEKLFLNTIIITENVDSPLAKIGKINNCKILNHESDIGGRYSIFSNVGMIPAIIAGLDVKQIHLGALKALEEKKDDTFLNIGKFFKYHKNISKLSNSVIMTYSDALFFFGKWYLQLWAESLGKNNKGITAIHSIGTTDQHSQLQLYLDGPKDKFFTFITTNHSKKGLLLNKKTIKEINENYLFNKTMGDLMQAEQKATMDTFNEKKIPFREIYLNEINEFSIGYLMAFCIMETIATCIYFDVDPFNQPAVERGKILTKEYLT